jgi:hypothetical protein
MDLGDAVDVLRTRVRGLVLVVTAVLPVPHDNTTSLTVEVPGRAAR